MQSGNAGAGAAPRVEPGTFQVDLRGLVDLLSHHLYSSPDVYVRELLQNAVDAITARREIEPEFPGAVEIEVHQPMDGPPTVVLSDNGIGLTETELRDLLATIGRSSKRADPGVARRPTDFIGRFGIGLLACFLVADEITVVTRSAADPAAAVLRWRGRADGTYDVTVLGTDLTAGTRVSLRARPGSEHRLNRHHVLRLARRYGGLLPVPIRLVDGDGDSAVVNDEVPPWEFSAVSLEQQRDAAVDFARRVLDVEPLDVIPLRAEGVRGLAFVLPHEPSPSAHQSHRVYLRRMLLTESADRLLPDWAYFVRCVIDADDLEPTASREGFRDDERLEAVRGQLGRCVRGHLVELARSHPDRLTAILAAHYRGITALAVHDEECLRLFADWLPLETSLGRLTLGEHTRRYDRLRFVSEIDDFRQIAPIAAAQGRCVVNAGYANLTEMLERLAGIRPDLDIAALDPTDIVETFEHLTLEERAEVYDLVYVADLALQPLGCAVEARGFEPAQLPVIFLTSRIGRAQRDLDRTRDLLAGVEEAGAWGAALETLASGGSRPPSTRLCLNARNPVVRGLAKHACGARGTGATGTAGAASTGGTDPVQLGRISRAIHLLYIQALLLGHHPLRQVEIGLLNDAILGFVEESAS